MALTLVGRGVRALSDHLNLFYRVLRGIDPDSLAIRLPTGGSFEIRHSQTNLPVVRVTDDGTAGAVVLPPGGVGTDEIEDASVTSAKIADGTIVNADINAAAGILVTKLDAGGTANRVLRTTNGTAATWGQVLSADIANINVGTQHIYGGGAGNANSVLRTTDGTATVFGKVTSADIADGTIANADVDAAAAIAITKLAHVGGGNVLRSNGTTNVAGQVASGDIADGTIVNADINAAAEIAITKIDAPAAGILKSDGTTITGGNQISSADIADGAIVTADINASAAIALSKLAAGASGVLLSDGTAITAGNQVATGNIAAGAVSQRQVVVVSNNPTFNGATLTTIPGSSISMTTTGGTVLLLATGGVTNNTSGGITQIAGGVDNVAQTGVLGVCQAPTAGGFTNLAIAATVQPSAGAHTFSVMWSTVSGSTATLNIVSFSAVELKK